MVHSSPPVRSAAGLFGDVTPVQPPRAASMAPDTERRPGSSTGSLTSTQAGEAGAHPALGYAQAVAPPPQGRAYTRMLLNISQRYMALA